MSDEQIPLHALNAHLLARLLPDTHGDPAPAADTAAPKLTKAQEKAAAKAAAAAAAAKTGEYTAEQLEVLKAAGIEDVAAADPQAVAAILGLPPQ